MISVTQTWWVNTAGAGRKKYCSRCNTRTDFVSSRKFRCNSNGKSIDVWLVYNCTRCKNSWNMPVEKRRRVSSIPSDRLQQYYANDVALADRISGGDSTTAYTVTKQVHRECRVVCIRLVVSGGIRLRTDRFFAGELGFSRNEFDGRVNRGHIRSPGSNHRVWRRPIRDGLIIEIDGECGD